ncbi:hypothetical protein F8M41_026052 [Gigaspora margarita]|uniref:Uncharacterized protein n=1 Tax=Gigaspora margarita TaxID=4874 RepID=A0A8H3XHG8_GIGMA|nr:hypothetical protein F8M41_026052 [Gigaspora margarita]
MVSFPIINNSLSELKDIGCYKKEMNFGLQNVQKNYMFKILYKNIIYIANVIANATTIMPKIREHFERAFNRHVYTWNEICQEMAIVDLQKHSILTFYSFICKRFWG